VDEDGNAVPLTTTPDIRWNGVPPRWAKDDSFFSYIGVVEGEQELIGRLYVVELDWTLGFPVAAAPVVAFEIRRPWADDWEYMAAWDEVNLNHHDWSPDGTEVALTAWVWEEGWVVNVASFSEGGVETRRLTYGANPAWSPDGRRIAFNRSQMAGYQSISDVWTIDPDGTGAAQVTKYSFSKSSEVRQFSPTWSPDGNHLAFTHEVNSRGKRTWSIMRIPATGGTATNLTATFGGAVFPRWVR
jgi:Tol biopolymer transport system component